MQAYYYRRWEPLAPTRRNWTQLSNAETLADAIGIVAPLAYWAPMEIGYGDSEAVSHVTTVTCLGDRIGPLGDR